MPASPRASRHKERATTVVRSRALRGIELVLYRFALRQTDFRQEQCIEQLLRDHLIGRIQLP